MKITLIGGPQDGKDLDITWNLWQTGTIRVPVIPRASAFRDLSELGPVDPFQTLTYHRQRWNPSYGCVFFDNDNVTTMNACEPIFKWLYFDPSHNWTVL